MRTLSRDQIKTMNEGGSDFVLINVLDSDSFNEQHIRTSINIPHKSENFVDLVELVAGDKNRNIIVYCASSECDASTKAAKLLEESGFKNVFDYVGGTQDWFAIKKSA